MEDRENYQIKRLIKSVKEETDKSKLIEIIRKNMSILASNSQLAESLANANELIKPILEEFAISIYPEEKIDRWITAYGMKSAIEKFGCENIPMKAIYSEKENRYVDYREEILDVASEYIDQGKYDSAEQIYQRIIMNRKDMIARFQEKYGNVLQEELEKSTIYKAKCGLEEIKLRRKMENGQELSETDRSTAIETVMEGYNTFGLELSEIQIEEIERQLVVYENIKPRGNGNGNPGAEKRDYVEELRPRNRFTTFKENYTIEKAFANPDKTGKILFILGGEDKGIAVLETYYTKTKDRETGEEIIQESNNVPTRIFSTKDLPYMTNISEIGETVELEKIAEEIEKMSTQELIQKLNEIKKSSYKTVRHRGRDQKGNDQGSKRYFDRLRKRIDEIKEYNSEEQKKSTQEEIEEPLDSQTENQEESLTEKEKIEQISEEQETVTRNEEIEELLDEHQEEKFSTKEEHFEESFGRVLEQMKICDMEYKRLIKIEQETAKRIEEISARREEIRSEIEEKMKLSMTDTLIEEIKYLIQERNSIMRNFQECLRIKSDIQVNVEENRKYRDSLNKQFEKEFNRGEENEG